LIKISAVGVIVFALPHIQQAVFIGLAVVG
jgi:hypothetical protein